MDIGTTCESEVDSGRVSLGSPIKASHAISQNLLDETKKAYRKRRGAFDLLDSRAIPIRPNSLEIIQKSSVDKVTEVFDYITPKKDFCPRTRPKSRS